MKHILIMILLIMIVLLFTIFGIGLAYEGSSVYDNTSPKSQVTGLVDKYPSNRYGLDYHVEAIGTNAIGIPDSLSDAPAWGMQALTGALWDGIRIMNTGTIMLFTWAFSLDIINGPNSVMKPIVDSMNNVYNALGGAWMSLGFVLVGGWAAHKALAKREVVPTFSALGMSALYILIGMFLIANMPLLLGGAFRITNEMANALLGAINGQDTKSAKIASANTMFETLVYDPWVVLNFGGMKHCVDKQGNWVKSTSSDCDKNNLIDNKKKYADRWLKAGVANSPPRQLEYEALRDGKIPSVSSQGSVVTVDPNAPAPSPQNPVNLSTQAGLHQFDNYKVSAADKPAVDIQQKEASGERLLYTGFVGGMSLGAAILIGGMSLGIVLAAIFALFLAAGTPFVMIAGMFPNLGHKIFRGWLRKLIDQPIKIVLYAIILSFIFAISNAMFGATSDLGWLAFTLLAMFFWLCVFKRKEIQVLMTTGVIGPGKSASEHMRDLYYMRRNARMFTNRMTGPLEAIKSNRNELKKDRPASYLPAENDSDQSDQSNQNDKNHKTKTGIKDIVGNFSTVAPGNTGRMIDAVGMNNTALDELESQHLNDQNMIVRENRRRSSIADLENRDKMSRSNIPGAEEFSLNDKQRGELEALRARQMDKQTYQNLSQKVQARETRRDRPDGQMFSEEEVAQKTREIASRNGGFSNGHHKVDSTVPYGPDGRYRDESEKQDKPRIRPVRDLSDRVQMWKKEKELSEVSQDKEDKTNRPKMFDND
jgi:hypothetical protein